MLTTQNVLPVERTAEKKGIPQIALSRESNSPDIKAVTLFKDYFIKF